MIDSGVDVIRRTILFLGPRSGTTMSLKRCRFSVKPTWEKRHYSKYASLDDKIDGFHYFTMFVKFGQGRAVDDACRDIRDGYITREEGVALVNRFGEFRRITSNFSRLYLSMKSDFGRQSTKTGRLTSGEKVKWLLGNTLASDPNRGGSHANHAKA